MSSPFETLGLEWDADERTVKRAYAKLIKEFRPDSHPVEFARIREAYEQAAEYLRDRAYWAEVEQNEAEDGALAQAQPSEHLLSESIADLAQKAEKQDSQFDQQFQTQQAVDFEEDALDIPPYQRLHTEQISEAELFRLLDSPEQTIQVLPDVAPQIKPDITEASLPQNNYYQLINQMLAELGQFKLPQQESEALACFNAQLQQLDEMSLDARMDYEDALGQWMLYSEQPPLRVFGAACRLFGWDADYLRGVNSVVGLKRFSELNYLSSVYKKITSKRLSMINTRKEFLELNNLISGWNDNCADAQLPHLQNCFNELSVNKLRFFVIDIFFALSFNVLFLNFMHSNLKITEHLILALLTCVMAFILPPMLRAFVLYFEDKQNGDASIAWIRLCSVILVFMALLGWFVVNIGNEQQLVRGVVLIVVLVAGWFWYALLIKREEKVLWLWQLMLDIPLSVENVVNKNFQNPYVRIIARVIAYIGVPILIFYQHFSKIVAWVKGIIKSSVVKVALKFLVITVLVLAGIIYSDYLERMKHRSVVKDYAEKLMQKPAQEPLVDDYDAQLMRERVADDYLDKHGLLSEDIKH